MLVACAHGTRNATGRRLVAELALAARRLRPGLVTTAAFVDVQAPTVVDVVAAYLLAPGHFHGKLAGAGAGADVVTAPLLPDERIAAVLLDRYDAALPVVPRG